MVGMAALPGYLSPMLATLGTLPPDDGWGFEMKWDGVRAIVRVDRGRITVRSRNDIDMSTSYPELTELGSALGSTRALLDGEIVTFDANGRPSFGALQQRMHVGSVAAARRLAESVPAVLLVFDVLHLGTASLLKLPYAERRERLAELDLAGPSWQTPPAFSGTGQAAVQASKDQQLEGVVAKRLDSGYIPGRRSPYWIKVKNLRTQEVVVGGWAPGQGRRTGMIGALLLGIPDADGLRYVGKVGTGFTEDMLADLERRLHRRGRATSPFAPDVPRADARNVTWVSPALVGEVAFSEWTADGRLRHPAWRGLRPDKAPADVVVES
jgi:bifunctional non-homologous end joining protein LigD